MSSVRRIRFNRSLFSVTMNGHAPGKMVAHLAAEDIELILDIRDSPTAEQQFDQLCEEAEIYYVHRPILAGRDHEDSDTGNDEVAKTATWVAGLSLRHRTCVIGDDNDHRLTLSKRIAESVGQRVIDIESSPAPIALQDE